MEGAKQGTGWRVWTGLAGLTLLAAGILGYHPYSEDGGIYLAEIKKVLDPTLYPHGTEFVSGHLGPSVFPRWTAWIVRSTGIQLDVIMLVLHLACLGGMLAGVWLLAVRCYSTWQARWGAASIVAVSLRVPVAGTSLLLMDPYVTARSAAMALTMLGMAALARFLTSRTWNSLAWAVLAFAGAVTVHPLMGGYGVVEAATLVCIMHRRRWFRIGGVLAVAFVAVITAGLEQALAAPETPAYWRVASTRYYWFLGEWQWFEGVGLVAPLAILSWVSWKRKDRGTEATLARMAVCLGAIAVGIAAMFAHENAAVHAVARMQPLRCFQMIYVVMLIVLGAALGERVLRRSVWRWSIAVSVIAGAMMFVQRQTYPASAYWELPGMALLNRWEQGFVWVSRNTPKEALFALDADYVQRPGEDTQGFRALAERSALPDYSKDGGQAAILPELTNAWVDGQKAQTNLTQESDVERLSALRPFAVTWIVVGREGITAFACPYENARIRICRLP